MSRIRTIKPEFWTSEQVVECSTTARLMFVGMWNFADDAGNLPASTKTLKMQIFPADNIDPQPLVEELVAVGLLREYTANGRNYWNITGWHHQKIDKPTYRHPLVDDGKIVEHSTSPRRTLCEPSPPEGSLRESSLMESKGKDGDVPRKRAHRLPEDWILPIEYRQAARQHGLTDAEIDRQSTRMHNWSLSSKGGAKLDWYRAWLNWIQEAPKGYPNKANGRVAAI